MSSASRNERRKRRQRRSISLLTRQSSQLRVQLQTTHIALLGVLAQLGGEVTVTKGTLAQVTRQMSWQTVPGANAQEFIVRVIEGSSEEDIRTVVEPAPAEEGAI